MWISKMSSSLINKYQKYTNREDLGNGMTRIHLHNHHVGKCVEYKSCSDPNCYHGAFGNRGAGFDDDNYVDVPTAKLQTWNC